MTNKITLTNGAEVEEGCYIDGHVGHWLDHNILYVGVTILGGAKADEWKTLATKYSAMYHPSSVMSDKDMCDLAERCTEAAEEVVVELNEITPAGYRWYIADNELFLSRHCGGNEDCTDGLCGCIDV